MTHKQIADYAREAAQAANAIRDYTFCPSMKDAVEFLAEQYFEDAEPTTLASEAIEAAAIEAYEKVVEASKYPYFRFVYERKLSQLERAA